jgi:hypothetical protein
MLARSLAVDTIKGRCRVVASKLVQSQYRALEFWQLRSYI